MTLMKVLSLVGLLALSHGQNDCEQDGCLSNDVALLPANTIAPSDHYYIGAMFGVHYIGTDAYQCASTRVRGLVNAEAFFWAIKKYSASLPISVGGFVMDSCQRAEKSIQNVYSFETCKTKYLNVSPRNTIAFVGPDSSTEALATSLLLKDMHVTQVSPAASTPALSDVMYNYFLRTVPSGATQTNVMVKFLLLKNVSYVQILYQDNDYGIGLRDAFSSQVKATNGSVCITKSMPIGNAAAITSFLSVNKFPRYIAILATDTQSRFVLETVNANSALNGMFIFLGTPSWGQDMSVIKGLTAAENAITFDFDIDFDADKFPNILNVTSFWSDFFLMKPANRNNSISAYVNDNPWFIQFWEKTFNCTVDGPVQICDLAKQSLTEKINANDVYVPFTLMAVEAIINGMKNAVQKFCKTNYVCSELLNISDRQRGPALYDVILNAVNSKGQRYFQDNGDAAVELENFKVFQVQKGSYYNVLRYSGSSQSTNFGFWREILPVNSLTNLCPDENCAQCIPVTTSTAIPSTSPKSTSTVATTTANTQTGVDMLIASYFRKGQEFTGVWQDQPREENDKKTRFENGHEWIIALGVSLGVGILCVLVFEIYILYKLIGTKIGKQWRTMWLGKLLLFSIFLCYLVLIAYLFTPTKATCGITRFGVGVSYAMCFAVLLVKLMVLLTSKTTSNTLLPGDVDSPNYLRGIYQFLMFFFVVGVQIAIDVQWLITIPPEAVQVYSNNGDKVWICNHYTWALDQAHGWNNMTMFVRTEFENHLISLVYVMFLILLTAVVAMKAHGIITNHRESIFIGLAAGFSIPVWITWGLIGGLNKDKAFAQEFGDGAIAFGLLITATILLFAMFLPKVRQLVNMGVEGIYLEDDRDTTYAGSVIMAPPSYKSRPSSHIYANNNGYVDSIIIGDANAVHLRHPGSTYSAPAYVRRPESTTIGSGKVLRMTGDLTGKYVGKKAMSEAGSGYGGTYRKSKSESGGTMRRAHSIQDLGAL